MGWVIGIAGSYSKENLKKLQNIHNKPINSFSSDIAYFAIGGNEKTSFFLNDNSNNVSAISGVGIDTLKSIYKIMNLKDWSEYFSTNRDVSSLDGHFIIVRVTKDVIHFQTDQLGLKNLFIYNFNNYIVFSSRLDWLSKFIGSFEIDWYEFSARWLLINQLSDNSIFKNVIRLSQGGTCNFNLNTHSLVFQNKPWLPKYAKDVDNLDIYSMIKKFTTCGLDNESKVSLALSGGLDSRVLLSILLSNNNKNWCLHSFFSEKHPDVAVAKKISKDLNIEHKILEQPIPSEDICIETIFDYIPQTVLTAPSSNFINLQFYKLIESENKIIIDGGSGEIARRRYLNNVLYNCRTNLLNRDVTSIIPYIRYNRAQFFTNDISEIMEKGLELQLNELNKSMPDIKGFGIENWLDLLAIRTRFPNFAGPEQARSDSEILNYMPYVQPSFLKKMFESPLEVRKNSRMFKKLINDNYPTLKKYPLVKGVYTYPYYLSNFQSSVYIKIKKRLKAGFKDETQKNFLLKLKNYILDLANSQSVKNCGYYNNSKIIEIVDGFYKGNFSYANQLDWWLAFETFRKVMNC